MQIGFVITSHANPPQLLRLVRTLQKLYDGPPIACHHDFSKCDLDVSQFTGVSFVTPHEKTGWGKFAVCRGVWRAIEILYEKSNPDWFFHLSGADYPTMNPARVMAELKSNGADALLDHREVPTALPWTNAPLPGNPALAHFVSKGNLSLAKRRYTGLNMWLPTIRSGPRLGKYTISLPIRNPSAPFDSNYKCYYGDFWFAGNRRVAEILTQPSSKHIELRRFYSTRVCPDESYFHTILANSPGLRISTDTRRFSQWNGGGAHPQILSLNDVPAILSSKAYFARKFAHNSDVLDELDETICGARCQVP